LGNPSAGFLEAAVEHYPCPKVFADQPKYSLIANLPGDPAYQDIMIHGVEKFRQICVYCYTISFADIFAHLIDGVMGRTSWTKSKA
jgi:hypothetical protein